MREFVLVFASFGMGEGKLKSCEVISLISLSRQN